MAEDGAQEAVGSEVVWTLMYLRNRSQARIFKNSFDMNYSREESSAQMAGSVAALARVEMMTA